MVLQIFFNKQKGFSLIEVVIVLGIIALFLSISISVYNTLRSNNNLTIATNSIVQALRFAKNNSEQVNSDTRWGISVDSDQVVVFSGDSYASRNTSKDKILTLPDNVTVTGTSEIVFEKLSGQPITTGNITITSDQGVKNILINEKGTITY